MREIGIATGTGGMPISSTIGSLFLTTASGADWMMDSSRGITCRITPATTIRTITTLTFSRTIRVQPGYNNAAADGVTRSAARCKQLTDPRHYSMSIPHWTAGLDRRGAMEVGVHSGAHFRLGSPGRNISQSVAALTELKYHE